MAAAALPMIESSMSIYLDAGTTNFELAELMTKQHWESLTVVTNDLAIAQVLTPVMGIYVILLGGHIDVESNSTCGVLATNMVQTMHFDICFLGTQAITPDWRIMTANAEKSTLNGLVCKRLIRWFSLPIILSLKSINSIIFLISGKLTP